MTSESTKFLAAAVAIMVAVALGCGTPPKGHYAKMDRLDALCRELNGRPTTEDTLGGQAFRCSFTYEIGTTTKP